jgi:CHAD domain-containing protein
MIGDEDLPLRSDDPTPEVGRRILRAQLRRLLDRERGFLAASGPEEIRRMRVAARRLRATWRAFGSAYTGRTPDRLRRRLGRLADALSAVRDLDVLLGRLDEHVAGPGGDAPDAFAGLAAAVTARRAAALRSLGAELASPRHRQWLDDFVRFVETPGRGAVPVKPPVPRLVREQVGGWIWSGFERLLAWEPLVGVADAETLHALRLETKRLRDVIQAAAPMASAPVEPVVATLVSLQDGLGALNDATVTAGVARTYLGSQPAGLRPEEISAIERFAESQERAAEQLRGRIPSIWRVATSPAARRRMARLVGSF